MRKAQRELGEGFAVYSAELKRAAIRLHMYGTYRPAAAFREWPQSGDQEIASRFETIIQMCKSNTLTGWSVQQKRHDRALTCSGIPTDRAPNVSSPFPLRFQMQDRRLAVDLLERRWCNPVDQGLFEGRMRHVRSCQRCRYQ